MSLGVIALIAAASAIVILPPSVEKTPRSSSISGFNQVRGMDRALAPKRWVVPAWFLNSNAPAHNLECCVWKRLVDQAPVNSKLSSK